MMKPQTKPRRWLWVVAVVVALIFGVAVGSAVDKSGDDVATTRETTTVTATVTNVETVTPAPPPPPPGPATTMNTGTYQVGVDVQPGRYKTVGPKSSDILNSCYWARMKDDSGRSIIANEILQGPGSVTINDGEFVNLRGECTWIKVVT